jgi:hypothetical protein
MEEVLKGKACILKVNTAVIHDAVKTLGLGIGGDVQKFADMEAARLSDPYAPSDTASLRKSVFARSHFGSGELIYEIYGNADGRNTWNDTTSKFQDAPMRGSYWFKRCMEAGGKDKLILGIKRFIQQRMGVGGM